MSSPFWHPAWTQISEIFKTCTNLFNVFSKRCSSHAFLVYLCACSDDFCTHFVFHVICAGSDLDCTGIAQTHVLTFECPEKLQKNEQKSVAIWNYILNGLWHHFRHMFWRISDFLEKIVVYKIECEKGAPKRWNKEWWLSPGAPWQPPSRAHFLNNKQQLSEA